VLCDVQTQFSNCRAVLLEGKTPRKGKPMQKQSRDLAQVPLRSSKAHKRQAQPDGNTSRLLRIVPAARLLGISANTLRRMIAFGDLPHVRIRRSVLVDRRDLEAFVEANKSVGA
jgi:excisionase family DNA binding protein